LNLSSFHTAMCLIIIFTSCLCDSFVLQLLLIIIKPWFQSFIISSSPTSMSSLLLPHLPQFSFYFQNRTCTETPLQVEVHEIFFPTSYHSHETGSEQKSYAYFTLAMQSVQGWFQTAQRSMFLSYLLIRVFKIDDSWCVGKNVWTSFWILNFLPLYISEHVLKSWRKQQLPSQAL
jgi:hypothetical protein